MRGINRLKLALAVWTTAALGLGGAGCQQMYPVAQTGMYPPAERRAYDGNSRQVVQTAYRGDEGNGNYLPPAHSTGQPPVLEDQAPAALPREKMMTMHPSYIIEPPDTLMIDAIRLIPRPPYRIEALDVLIIQVAETLPNQPIAAAFSVTPDGFVNLGYSYGMVRVAGLTLEQGVTAVKTQLKTRLADPQVAVALAVMRAIQQIRGEHLVGQDGTVTLGSYGCVNVTGLTLWQAKLVMERYLSHWFLNPQISITVNGFNSKVYYVIFDGGGYGQQILRLPITGNERVLDAISLAGGLPPVASRRKIWVSRPSPKSCYQLLPVDWEAITKGGDPESNWQLFPGDRVYVAADPLIELDNSIAKIFAPIERVLGITLLGTSTFQSFRNNNNSNGNNGGVIVP